MTLAENTAVQPSGRIKAFTYATAEKAACYRAIMRAFIRCRERFVLQLRPQEILDEMRTFEDRQLPDLAEIESAVSQLCEWGNLDMHPDTTSVRTVEDFYKQRYIFEITKQGEAAERGLELFEMVSERQAELQTSALADIRDVCRKLKELSTESAPDPVLIHHDLVVLRARFEDLTADAEGFMSSLQRQIDLQFAQSDQFTSSTRRLIDYVERFVTELMISADDIGPLLRDIETAGVERLLRAAAQRRIADTLEGHREDFRQWHADWQRIRQWFISRPGHPSNAERLRAHARSAVSTLLSVITTINDQRIHLVDRSNDLRVLARWFAEARSDDDAHRLWRVAFGLCPARHLLTNDSTLNEHEAQDVPADTSWLDAPPLRISPRLREYGSYSRTGRFGRIIDRTAEKEKLAAATHDEALRILSAQSRFATGQRMRLSDLTRLETREFDVFLELLEEALSAKAESGDTAEVLASDGALRVKLEPTGDGRVAVIETPEGYFSGPDHWISVERISPGEVVT